MTLIRILHYGLYDFSSNGQPTITVKPPYNAQWNSSNVGQRKHLSDADKAGMAAIYGPVICVSPSGSDSNPGTLALPKLTIQAAINASVSGDKVLIADGTYTGSGNVDLDFGGRNITVTSLHGTAYTIINCGGFSSNDGSGDHRGFYIHSGETNAVISGLTIENGYENGSGPGTDTQYGGGILIAGSSAVVRNCIVTGNFAVYDGGGIDNNSNSNSTIIVTNCSITNNSAEFGCGVANNAINGGTIALTNCTVKSNATKYATYFGTSGGVYNVASNSGIITLTNCTITGNTATSQYDASGGGIYNDNQGTGLISVTNCNVAGNTANAVNGSGGGIYNDNEGSGTITVINCTLTGNQANYGGGIFTSYFSTAITVINDIFYGDTGGEVYNDGGGVTATYCDIQGGYTGTGNKDANPLFVKSSSPYDLHLLAGSPCLGAGTHTGAPATTLDGVIRPIPPSMGAYESAIVGTTTTLRSNLNPAMSNQSLIFTATIAGNGGTPTGAVTFTVDGIVQSPVTLTNGAATYTTSSLLPGSHSITAAYSGDTTFASSSTVAALTQMINTHISPQYVSPSGNDSNPGTQAAPKLTIQAAINATFSGDTVIVENGTYTGTGNADLVFGGRNITVTSQNGAASTIINCQGSSSASHRGFYIHQGETSAVISGLTIENGYVTNSSGAGIENTNVGVTVQNCTLTNNTAAATGSNAAFGGGIYDYTSTSNSPMIVTNCIVTGNAATSNGGGIDMDDRNASGTISVTGCTLTNNSSLFGGGIATYGTGANSITGCIFTSNPASNEGGGIYNQFNNSSSPLTITNCAFTGNTSPFGGGLYNYNGGNSTISMINCTLTGNSATSNGGGIYDSGNGAITATNDIFYGDTGGEIKGSSIPTTYSDVQGGYTGTGNKNANPLFVSSPTNLHLLAGSPCLSAGTHTGAPATTIDGVTRPNPPSIGAYEGIVVASNVSGQVTVTHGGFARIPRTTMFSETVMLTNTSGTAITGPVSLVLDGLTSGVTLANESGVTVNATPSGNPYLSSAASLAAGGSVTLTLKFNDPGLAAIAYTRTILAGAGSR